MKIPNTTTDYQTSLDILREQRQIRRERFFSSPGLIMGLTVFILIVMAAIIIPAVANVDPNGNGHCRPSQGAKSQTSLWHR